MSELFSLALPIGAALLGALIGAVVALLPGLHAYTLVGVVLAAPTLTVISHTNNETTALFLLGLVVGWVMVNLIPAIFFFAPDDAHVRNGVICPKRAVGKVL